MDRASAESRSVLPQPSVSGNRLSLAQRRRQLIEAARRVFAERGFRGATTRQVAAAAGVTEALIFQHFPDKDALYAAILDEEAARSRIDDWLAEIEGYRAAGADETVIRRLYTFLITQHEADPDLIRLIVFSALENHPLAQQIHGRATRIYKFLESFIADGQRCGRFRPGSPAVLARATLALPVYYILQRHLFKTIPSPVTTAEVIEEGVTFTLAGLRDATPKRRAQPAAAKVGSS
jgi:TetR/AcrR family transcriptional regulator